MKGCCDLKALGLITLQKHLYAGYQPNGGMILLKFGSVYWSVWRLRELYLKPVGRHDPLVTNGSGAEVDLYIS